MKKHLLTNLDLDAAAKSARNLANIAMQEMNAAQTKWVEAVAVAWAAEAAITKAQKEAV